MARKSAGTETASGSGRRSRGAAGGAARSSPAARPKDAAGGAARKEPASSTPRKSTATRKKRNVPTSTGSSGSSAGGSGSKKSTVKPKNESKPKNASTDKSASPKRRTTGKKSDKARKPRSTTGNNGELPAVAAIDRDKPLPKTRLSDKDLEEFRELLLEKRCQLIGDVTDMEEEAMRPGGSAGNNTSSMPIHMADLGSDTWEQEFTLGLIASERQLLVEIDQALERINNKTYAICLATGRPISKARLRAKPWAKYCIAYAREQELRRG